MNKINLNDNIQDVVLKMSKGNPGAINVIMEMLKHENENIDPDCVLGVMMKVLHLDSLSIYGTDIYILYNDICDRNMIKMFAILRAYQLGFLNGSVLKDASQRQDRSGKQMIDVDMFYEKVKEQLPNFKKL